MKIRIRLLLGASLVLISLGHSQQLLAQNSLESQADKAAENADRSAQDALDSARAAVSAIERANKIAKEIATEAGIELPASAGATETGLAVEYKEPVKPVRNDIPVSLGPQEVPASATTGRVSAEDTEMADEAEFSDYGESSAHGSVSAYSSDSGDYAPSHHQGGGKEPVSCPVECCPAGSLSVGYATDYIFRGVRLAEDVIIADVNYQFGAVKLGMQHVTGLSSAGTGLGAINNGVANADGDQTNLYAKVGLPTFMGIDATLGYDHYFYSNQRVPSGAAGTGAWGDSHGALSLSVSREMFGGVIASYTSTYDFNVPHNFPGALGVNAGQSGGSWIHEFGLSKEICVTDCVKLNLSGGILYTDGVWDRDWTGLDGSLDRARSSGWNSYYVKAELPIHLNKCVSLVPYIAYNGSPDSWIADGVNADFNNASNDNDILNGGISVKVRF